MKLTTYYINLTGAERFELIRLLIKMKNKCIEQGKYTDVIDETIYNVSRAKTKKFKVVTVK